MDKIIETTIIPLAALRTNDGQIPGVPKNPRTLDENDFDDLVMSLQDDPEMPYYRELDVWQMGDIYVVLGGNMRLQAMRRLEWKESPCKIIPPESTVEQLKAYVIKDNVTYGAWNTKDLDEEWSQYDLSKWGTGYQSQEEREKEPKEDESKEHTEDLVFSLGADEFKFVKQELNKIDKDNAKALIQKLMQYES